MFNDEISNNIHQASKFYDLQKQNLTQQ